METLDVGYGRGVLPRPAAESLLRMDAHVRALGKGDYVPTTELGRTYERQLYLYVNQNKPGFNPAWHPDDPRANHVLKEGRTGAADSDYQTGYPWEEHGWILTVPHEPWHREYFIGRDAHLGKDKDMAEAYMKDSKGNVFHIINGKKYRFTSPADFEAWRKIVNGMGSQTSLIKVPALNQVKRWADWQIDAVVKRLS